MIAQELEVSLHMAFVEARQQRHEFITVEHLLLALLDNPSAAEVLRACSANIDDLRKSLANFIKDNTPQVAGTEEVDTQPTLGFQRVIQRAIMHVQSTGNGKKEVTGANVLVAIFGEKDSHAVYYLHQQGVTRLDVEELIHCDPAATAAFVGSLFECLTGRALCAGPAAELPAGAQPPRAARDGSRVPSFARPTAATVAAAASRQPAVEAISDDRLRAAVVGAAVAQYERALVVDRLQNPQQHAARSPGGAQARRAAASLARRQLQQSGLAGGGAHARRGESPPARGGASGWR